VLALAATLSPVSLDMLTPSLPGLVSDTGASPQTIELTLYSFLLGYGLAPSVWGALSDRVGRRPVMFIGMVIYSLSSITGAMIDDAGSLIALRFVQGIGGGAGATMARAIVRDLYGADGTTQGMARMISLMAVVPFFMPLLGGLLASILSWKACFVFMALVGIVSVSTYLWLVPETLPPRESAPVDGRQSVMNILGNRIFAQHVICNMFCVGIFVIFGANFAFVTAREFQFDAAVNGIVLAMFNGSVLLGTQLVWFLMSRLSAHGAILSGTFACVAGWLGIALLARADLATPALLAPMLVLQATGCGVIIGLCSGGALTPFTHNSGTASSLYLLIQSAGSCAISLAVGQFLPKELLPIALACVACSGLALLSKYLLSPGEKILRQA
jgi:DHA1 family bicyclomycin/chloramphenicol resistance-like MFS transporter